MTKITILMKKVVNFLEISLFFFGEQFSLILDELESSTQATVTSQSAISSTYFSAESTTEVSELAKTGFSDPYFTEFNPKLEHQNFKVIPLLILSFCIF